MASLLDRSGDHALKRLYRYLKEGTDCKIMWKNASKYFDKLEDCINEVVLKDKTTTEMKKVFTDMESTLKTVGIYHHLKKPYQDIKAELLKASYLKETFTASPTADTPKISKTNSQRSRDGFGTGSPVPQSKTSKKNNQRSRDAFGTGSPVPKEKQKPAKIGKEMEHKDAAVYEENKRLKDELTSLRKRIKDLEEEQDDKPSSKNLAIVKEKAKEHQRQQRFDSENKTKLSLLYEESKTLNAAINKSPVDFDQSRTPGKGKHVQNEKESKTLSDVDELFTKITENIKSGEECIKVLLDEKMELKDQLSANDNTIHDIDCKIKEILNDQTTDSQTVNNKASKNQGRKNKKDNVPPQTYDAKTAVNITLGILEQYVENTRASQTRNEENVDNWKKTMDNMRKKAEKLSSANMKICDLIPGYEDKVSSDGTQGAVQHANETGTSLEYEINIMARITNNLVKIVMPHIKLLYQELWEIGNGLGVEQSDKSKLDTTFLNDVKGKIDVLIREQTDLRTKGRQVVERVKKLKQWNMKFKETLPIFFNDCASVETANPVDDETMDVYAILNRTEECQSLLFRWVEDQNQKEMSVQEIQRKQEEKLQRLQEKLQRRNQSMKTLTEDLETKERMAQHLQCRISSLETEKNGLLGRLSRTAGEQLTSGNPDITDLSDPNRPQKIGEQYSELYDNEWTDAYAQIIETCGTEQKCIDALLTILKKSFEFCRQRAEEQWNNIISAIFLNHELKVKLKDTEFKELKNMRKLAAVKSNPTVQQEFRTSNILKDFGYESTLKYTDKCIELCWYMAVQDPPLWLHWDVQHKEKLNENMFKPYTNSGTKVDFLVWPVLKMHQDGAIVTKGVCQPIKTRKP